MVPAQPEKPKEEQVEVDVIKLWTNRFTQAEKFLEPYFERDQQAFEFWYMWREFRGPYRANIFPPDAHAAVESIVPRLTKGRPRPIVKGGTTISGEFAQAVQRGHSALWEKMEMDDKWEILTKRGTWFGFGVEKITWKTTGHEDPVLEDVLSEDGKPTGAQQPVLNPDGTPKTRFVADYHAPCSEIMDPSRVYFPRGYAREEDLPWVLFQYFKRVSELDPALYSDDDIKRLKESGGTTARDHSLDRDKVHRLPRMSQVLGQTDSDNLHEQEAVPNEDEKDDPVIELWEIYARPDRKHPKGRRLYIGNRKVVVRDPNLENDMPEHELPLVAFGYIDDTFNLRGMGAPREIERLVLERADKRNQRMDNVSRNIDRATYLQQEETVEDGDLTHRPNAVVRLRDLNNIKREEPANVTADAYREDDMIVQDMAKANGANEYVVGGGKRQDEALGQTDYRVSSSNERYDGVIRRLERALNRHARLVHMLVRQNWDEDQTLGWTDASGAFQEEEFSPEHFRAVDPKRVQYDAKSVIAYKEVSRKQGMQLLDLTDKLLSGDALKITALKPILVPLLELFDEIKVNPVELVKGIEAYAQAKASAPLSGDPAAKPVMPVDEGTPTQSTELSTPNRI